MANTIAVGGIPKRKEWFSMEFEEKERYVNAINKMKEGPQGTSRFYKVATYHDFPYRKAKCVHRIMSFVTWHRLYMQDFERELQAADQEVQDETGRVYAEPIAVAYWDWGKLDNGFPFHEERLEAELGPKAVQAFNRFPDNFFPSKEAFEGSTDQFYPGDAPEVRPREVDPKHPDWYGDYHYWPPTGDDNPIRRDSPENIIKFLQCFDTSAVDDKHGWVNVGEIADESFLECDFPSWSTTGNPKDSDGNSLPKPKENIERPHDYVHIIVSGTGNEEVRDENGNFGPMGYNSVAAFDPIFHLHHANIERYFEAYQTVINPCSREEFEEKNLVEFTEPLDPWEEDSDAAFELAVQDPRTYVYDALPNPSLPTRARERFFDFEGRPLPLTFVVFEGITVRDLRSPSSLAGIFLIPLSEEDGWEPPMRNRIDWLEHPDFARPVAFFTGGKKCQECQEADSYNMRLNVTSSLRKRNLTWQDVALKVVVFEERYHYVLGGQEDDGYSGLPIPKLLGPEIVTTERTESVVVFLEKYATMFGLAEEKVGDPSFGDHFLSEYTRAFKRVENPLTHIMHETRYKHHRNEATDVTTPNFEGQTALTIGLRNAPPYLIRNGLFDEMENIVEEFNQTGVVQLSVLREQPDDAKEEPNISIEFVGQVAGDMSVGSGAFIGAGGVIAEAKNANIRLQRGNVRWSLNPDECGALHTADSYHLATPRFSLRSVVLHQLGHVLGLGLGQDGLMSPIYDPDLTVVDDVYKARIQAIYQGSD